jgi:CubicO group peptidase (beta-lactamase class C family)
VEAAGLVIVKDGSTIFREAFGKYTVESADLLWSATKLASATAMMSVIDDGLARLDDPISRHLPAFTGVKGGITIRQLLAQTHGLPADHPTIAAPLRDNNLTLAESVDQIARDLEPEYAPGSRHRYAPAASYAILGRIAEVVTGQAWEELFAERVGTPLAMKTFTYGETRNPRIGGGAACALDDYANLLQMHLEGGLFGGRRVLSEASVLEMRRDQLHGVPFTSAVQKREYGYGLTWWFDEVDAQGEAIQLSVPGGLGAIPWINVQRRYAAFLLIRKTLAASVAVYESILPLIHQALVA